MSGHGQHTQRSRAVLGPAAALGAFAAELVLLASVGHPLVPAACFLGLLLLARAVGAMRLVVVSVLVGAGMLIMVPGFALVDGSFAMTFGDSLGSVPSGPWGWLAVAAAALRVPASVLAVLLLWLVPGRLLVAATSQLSPRTGLLGGLAARLRPLLQRDLTLVRDELASRGHNVEPGGSGAARISGVLALWEAAIAGMLDRAFQTAAALETRGYGRARPTCEPMTHPVLREPAVCDPRVERLELTGAAFVLVGVPIARALGLLIAPGPQPLANVADPMTPLVALSALIGCALCVLPLTCRSMPGRERAAAASQREDDAPQPSVRSGVLLDASGVSMRYPRSLQPSLIDASLTMKAGELVIAAGMSGSGKSTLLDVVSGVAPSATGGIRSGVVRRGAHVIASSNAAGRGGVAAVFQVPESQVLVGPVAEEVAFGLRHAGRPIAEVEQRVLAMLDRLGIRHLAQRDCATLSGGELQRVLLASALAMEPDILVLDEPTSQIDAASERAFWQAVDDARRERGIAVLVAEHRLDVVLARADRVLICDGGRIAADVPVAQLQQVAPWLLADPYVGLAPATLGSSARLVVGVPRLDVGDRGGPGRTLLRSLGLSVPASGIVTLEGPNGTGKSTLLRTIRGLHGVPSFVSVDGVARGSVASSVRQFAMLSQGVSSVLPGRSVGEAVEATSRRLGQDVAHARQLLVGAGLADRWDAHPSELSVGQRQRLALVAATAHRPAVWLLDEPTRGMDAAARTWVARHVVAHAAAGGVVLMATHDAALAAAVATHRLRLDLRAGPSLLLVQRNPDGSLVVDSSTAVAGEREPAR